MDREGRDAVAGQVGHGLEAQRGHRVLDGAADVLDARAGAHAFDRRLQRRSPCGRDLEGDGPLTSDPRDLLGRADGFACKNPLGPAIYDGFIMGVGFTAVLVLLGAMRELIGTGAIFANMDLLLGPAAADWKLVLVDDYQDFLLAILPPGAFIFTGLIIAGKNLIDAQIKRRQDALKEKPAAGSKRVRVTGHIS